MKIVLNLYFRKTLTIRSVKSNQIETFKIVIITTKHEVTSERHEKSRQVGNILEIGRFY